MEKNQPEKLICPVCGKEFKETEDTMYFIGKDPTCTWKCFLDYQRTHPTKKNEQIVNKSKKR